MPAPQDDVPVRQVNNILQNLRGEHFRHAQNVQGRRAATSSLSSHTHNQPTLPIDLIHPAPAPATSPSWIPGPTPPRSWRSPVVPDPTTNLPSHDNDTPAWRERALSPLFSSGTTSGNAHPRLIFPDPCPIPRLTLLCLQLIRDTCPGADLAQVVPYIPPHLRRALLRYTAVHAPLTQIELDALCQGATHVDTELVVVGPHNALRGRLFRKCTTSANRGEPGESWDTVQMQDSDLLALRSLALLSSPLNAATMLAFPPTITHLALIKIPHPIPLLRLPAICPLVVFLDLSYNEWLYTSRVTAGAPMLEEVQWEKWKRLEVVGLRECLVTPKVLLELNRGRWADVKVIR